MDNIKARGNSNARGNIPLSQHIIPNPMNTTTAPTSATPTATDSIESLRNKLTVTPYLSKEKARVLNVADGIPQPLPHGITSEYSVIVDAAKVIRHLDEAHKVRLQESMDLLSDIESLRAELDAAKGYAIRLLEQMHPGIKVLPNLPHILTQIENVWAGQRVQVERLLAHCDKEAGECSECGKIICPHQDSLHFHHDGCPSCAEYFMNKIKYNVATKINWDNKSILLTTSSELEGFQTELTHRIIQTEEKAAREGLARLGWLSPELAKEIEEALEHVQRFLNECKESRLNATGYRPPPEHTLAVVKIALAKLKEARS